MIDAAARIPVDILEAWWKGKMTDMLLVDVKGAFNYVSRYELMRKMVAIGAGSDLVR